MTLGMRARTRLAGHGLRAEGAAYTSERVRLEDPSGPGHALCQCGWLSPEQPNRARRQRAHRDHKDELRGAQ